MFIFMRRSLFAVAVLLASAVPTSFASENNLPVFQADILKKMNEFRARHGVLPLKMNATLNQYADERVNSVSLKEGLAAGHAGLKKGYGENLYWSYSSGTVMFSGTAAAENWYAEQKEYKGDAKGSADSERFTQMLWKGSTEVGCSRVGKQESSYFSTYIVCVFAPQGNVTGQFAVNVLPESAAPPAKIPSSKKR